MANVLDLDSELRQWPLEAAEKKRIREHRISMFGRTNWKGYPSDFLKFGRTWPAVMVAVGLPIAIMATLIGLSLAGSPGAAMVFSGTLLAEWIMLLVLIRWRRRAGNRAAAVELGFPVCLNCGYFNIDHQTGDNCSECGAKMVELPSEMFPPAEEDDLVKAIRSRRRRSAASRGHGLH